MVLIINDKTKIPFFSQKNRKWGVFGAPLKLWQTTSQVLLSTFTFHWRRKIIIFFLNFYRCRSQFGRYPCSQKKIINDQSINVAQLKFLALLNNLLSFFRIFSLDNLSKECWAVLECIIFIQLIISNIFN